jgi:hypothetical protein
MTTSTSRHDSGMAGVLAMLIALGVSTVFLQGLSPISRAVLCGITASLAFGGGLWLLTLRRHRNH